MSKFINHWNHQIYKALEASYQLGLESLNESMGELKVEMVYNSKQIQFKPPLESIRSKYYTKMKAFIEFPGTKFTGFSENNEGKKIFSSMAGRNTDSLTQVYVKSEEVSISGCFVRRRKIDTLQQKHRVTAFNTNTS